MIDTIYGVILGLYIGLLISYIYFGRKCRLEDQKDE
jgi:hypothetical protein